MPSNKSELHAGHRQRMVKKLEMNALNTHELLETLLFTFQPRKNTNEIAHRLLDAFGSMYGIFQADVKELVEVEGVGTTIAASLKSLQKIMDIYAEGKATEEHFPSYFETAEFPMYLQETYGNLEREVLDIYCLNDNKRITYRQRYTSGEKGGVSLEKKELLNLFRIHDPRGIIVVHNHPSGECYPSKEDDTATIFLQFVCSISDVLFCDHYICADKGVYSYYAAGRMQRIAGEFGAESIATKTNVRLFGE